MTEEQIITLKKTVNNLYSSVDIEDKICGLLMDLSVGCVGLYEAEARTKAVAILELIEKGTLKL